MTDSEGRTVPPAVMNYAQQARALEDSLEWKNNWYDDKREKEGVDQDMREEEATADFREALKDPKFAQRKVGGETMQEHHDFARDRAKRDTSMYMNQDEGHNQFGKDPHVQRMPR